MAGFHLGTAEPTAWDKRSLLTTRHQRVKSQFCHRTGFHKTSKHDEIDKYINHDQVHVQWRVLVGFSNHVRSTRLNMARCSNGTCKQESDLSKLLQFISTNHWQSKDSIHGNQVLNGVWMSQQRSIWQVNRKTLISKHLITNGTWAVLLVFTGTIYVSCNL